MIRRSTRDSISRSIGLLLVFGLVTARPLRADDVGQKRAKGVKLVRQVQKLLEQHYYDRSYRGLDLVARFRTAEAQMAAAPSTLGTYAVIAGALADLHDSDTFLIPPFMRQRAIDPGWSMQMVGETCRIVALRPGSAAETSGLVVGHAVEAVEGVRPTRDNLANMRYSLEVLFPRPEVRVAVAGEGQHARDLIVKGDPWPEVRHVNASGFGDDVIGRLRRRAPDRVADVGPVLVWKPGTLPADAGRSLSQVLDRARRTSNLVLDLRGYTASDLAVLGAITGLFGPGEEVARVRTAKGTETVKADAGHAAFSGTAAVLIDSDTAAVGEVAARWLQMKGRARVLGDRSAGAPRLSRGYPLNPSEVRFSSGGRSTISLTQMATHGMSLSHAVLSMPDGGSLEGVGVVPDEIVLPSPSDLVAGRDPALARAIAAAGVPSASGARELGPDRVPLSAIQPVGPDSLTTAPLYFPRP